MFQKVLKTGNSLAVVIPADFVKRLGIKTSDQVKVVPKVEKGEVIYKFSGALQLPLSENFLFSKKHKVNSKKNLIS